MGGVLSLISASRLPVRGVVAMSTPYQLPDHALLRLITDSSPGSSLYAQRQRVHLMRVGSTRKHSDNMWLTQKTRSAQREN